MAEYDVFLCHATPDKPAVEELAKRLRDAAINPWLDKWNIILGSPAPRQLSDAINQSACCVIFIGSGGRGPWQSQEIQAVTERQARDLAFRVIPVRLPGAPAFEDLADVPIFVKTNPGVEFENGLSDDDAFQSLIAGIRGQPRSPAPGMEKPGTVPTYPSPGSEDALIIHLHLDDRSLTRRFFDRHCAELLPEPAPLSPALPSPLSRNVGNELFDLLFRDGIQDRWPDIRRRIIGETAEVNPSRYPLRLRLHVNDSGLASLPWSRLQWTDQSLDQMGWSVELAEEDDATTWPGTSLSLNQHDGVLLIIPDQAVLDRDAHAGALLWHFEAIWSRQDQLRIVSDADGIRQGLRQIRPGIVYFFGIAEHGPDGLTLRSDDGARLTTLPELAMHWRRPPQIVFLNLLIDPTQAAAVIWAARTLLGQVPLVIVQYGARDSDRDQREAHRSALDWFEALLRNEAGASPVRLLHRHGLPTAVAWSDHGTWQIDLPDPRRNQVRDRLARLLLDREDQRRAALDATLALVHHKEQRMICFLCYGGPSDMGGWFGRQIQSHIRRRITDQFDIRIRQCRLPPGDGFSADEIRNGFFETFKMDASTDPQAVLLAAKRKLPGNRTLVMMLDWQARSLDRPRQGLTANALRNWLGFCADTLAGACPRGMRVVGCLVVQGSPDKARKLDSVFTKLKKEFNARTPLFHLEVLNPLHHVDEEHIVEYLRKVGCPGEFHDSLPALILAQTGGDFEKTVRLLDEQQFRMGWNRLAQWLGEQHGRTVPIPATPPDDDEDDQPL